ncbi:MAG TPA: HAD family hydrolase [Anaerolineales bacterium]|nr:HAD family hydrolase [Anaerolineales bacterium]
MSLTLLFDLDDTLLDTNLEAFVPAYFQALANHMASRVSSDVMVRALVQGLSLMNESRDPTRTLQEIFDADFYNQLDVPKAELVDVLEEFYDTVFPALKDHTKPRPAAAPLIEWALYCGFRVAIATDPFFPRKATYHRLRWAGLDPEQLELISTFEHFHFSKTHPAYYAEVLGRLGWPDGSVLVVGNDMQRDLLPAHRLGLKTFLVEGDSVSHAAQGEFVVGRGKLEDLRPWLESVNLSSLEPSFNSPESIMGIMLSTPAVLRSLSLYLTSEEWRNEPTPDDWALNEIVCHLRDTEIEIHQLQLDLMLARSEAFIPRPDTSVWANEREYLNVDGPTALADFASARLVNLAKLNNSGSEIWSRKARHAIFGPTNFLEVISFIADHDRMHVQQAWKTLQSLQQTA